MSLIHPYTETIEVHVALTGYGDALFYGALNTHHFVSGQSLKQRLFAWHAPSFYGTELETRQIEDIDLVVLPAEEVIRSSQRCTRCCTLNGNGTSRQLI